MDRLDTSFSSSMHLPLPLMMQFLSHLALFYDSMWALFHFPCLHVLETSTLVSTMGISSLFSGHLNVDEADSYNLLGLQLFEAIGASLLG